MLRLAEHIDGAGRLTRRGADALVESVAVACRSARERGCDDLLAFATSALRDARDGVKVLDRVRSETGVDLQLLTGPDEARLTFLAVRRWFGWSAGRLVVLDIGGGSLELACGLDEEPELAESVPLGAGRLTRERLRGDPPRRGCDLSPTDRGRSDAGRAGGTGARTWSRRPGRWYLEDLPLTRAAGRCSSFPRRSDGPTGADRDWPATGDRVHLAYPSRGPRPTGRSQPGASAPAARRGRGG